MKRYLIICLLIITILLTLPVGCKSKTSGTTLPASSTTATTTPRGTTGTITLGTNVDLGSEGVGTEGGGITISKPGDPLDGLTIGVPPESSPGTMTYKITYAPVTSHTFGDDFIAASPMITVDNGGDYADQLISVRVPVKIPAGNVAMGFLYDSATKKLEGMNLLDMDTDSITVGTRHFSSFLIGMIEKTKLKDVVDSGFWPGVDDWQFTNRGSYIASGGHCEGQSISAMWYYSTKPDGEEAYLYNRYDNNGNQPATPDLWQDDSFGYRFCSVIQKDIDYSSFANKFWPQIAGRAWQKIDNKWQWVNVPKLISDKTTRDLFAFAIRMTGEPQEVVIKSESNGGHAMICYRVSKDALYVADPNYPGNLDRKIELVNNAFKPYNSGANKDEIEAGKGLSFEHIIYQAKSTIIDWNDIAKRWTEFKNGTIGNDKFPQYKTLFREEKGQQQELLDGSVCTTEKIWIGNLFQGEATASVGGVWRGGKWLVPASDGYFYLNPGNNLLGILVDRIVGNTYKYVDFKYINVVYQEPNLSIDPASLDGKTGEEYTFTAKTDIPIVNAVYEWFVDGDSKSKSADIQFQTTFDEAGDHTVRVDLCLNDKVLKTVEAVVNIVGGTTTPTTTQMNALQKLQQNKYLQISLLLRGNEHCKDWEKEWVRENTVGIRVPTISGSDDDYRHVKITWNGTSFSGEYTSGTEKHTLTGTVSADASIITNLNYTYTSSSTKTEYGTTYQTDEKITFKLKDVPLGGLSTIGDHLMWTKEGVEIQNYVVEYSTYKLILRDGKLHSEVTVNLSDLLWNASTKPNLQMFFYPAQP